eukprot:TRINITY_DN682_c0_g1_i11.p1 TRINITY_DN682_c0_g1~~TRINITY_DN682_c0_g1_i11.p1  ORF type:complete len:236 (+),score=48.50 TRINITY_DN682_c0_g1_i11:620-1327(+)
MGPMIQQQHVTCDSCRGTGEVIPASDRCVECNGKKTISENKVLKIDIEKGLQEDKKIIFRGESNEEPGCVTGDIIFVIKEVKHAYFHRDGVHLLIQKDIPLVNALTGISFNIKHLDGRTLHISTPPGDIIKHEDVREIPNEGMPIHGSPFNRGSLYIKFNVVFPTSLGPKAIRTLKKSLPGDASESKPAGAAEEVFLEQVDKERMHRNSHRASAAYDESSDEDNDHQGGVSCQQQ